MSDMADIQEQIEAVSTVMRFRPAFTAAVVSLSLLAAILEGVGLSFILPIIEYARASNPSDPSGILGVFIATYDFLGVPFALETIVLGVGVVMLARYTTSFFVAWLRARLRAEYLRHLRAHSFQCVLNSRVSAIDERGSDDVLNAMITQSEYSSLVIRRLVEFFEILLVSVVYLAIALYISPHLTLFAVLILGGSTLLLRVIFKSGFAVGDRIARANEDIQQVLQSGTQGLRDVKLFRLESELGEQFQRAMSELVEGSIIKRRNRAGINNFQQLTSAVSVFVLIYLGLQYASLSIGSLGVFLFAMFRLSPRVSSLNDIYYQVETEIPHLIRSKEFTESLSTDAEQSGDEPAPETVAKITAENVSFAYDDEPILRDVSFTAEKGEFVAFVGPSGAGKSTAVSLLPRLHDPDSGLILANGRDISDIDLGAWREQIAVVRQQPYIFNETLRFNLTIGNREATQEHLDEVCQIARVDEFLADLPDGYETTVGDDGVRLSGGQKQRVALARALLKDAELLILDEATSDLDKGIEAEVQQAIERMERDCINITVAHRLSTVRNADRIYTFEDGEITEVGRHDELVEADGTYADLHAE